MVRHFQRPLPLPSQGMKYQDMKMPDMKLQDKRTENAVFRYFLKTQH